MSHARIRSVRMKSGGAEVRVLHNRIVEGADKIVSHARALAEMSAPGAELVGFVQIGMYADGTSSIGCHYDPRTAPIPRALFPSWIAEVIRRDLVTAHEAEEVACAVVNRANGFDD